MTERVGEGRTKGWGIATSLETGGEIKTVGEGHQASSRIWSGPGSRYQGATHQEGPQCRGPCASIWRRHWCCNRMRSLPSDAGQPRPRACRNSCRPTRALMSHAHVCDGGASFVRRPGRGQRPRDRSVLPAPQAPEIPVVSQTYGRRKPDGWICTLSAAPRPLTNRRWLRSA